MIETTTIPSIPIGFLTEIEDRLNRFGKKRAINWRVGFDKYYAKLHKIHSVYRTVLTFDKDISLPNSYLDMRYSDADGEEHKGREIWENIRPGERIVIRGTGGSGKSLFSKMSMVWTINSSSNRLPLFLDLKALNTSSNSDIFKLLHKDVNAIFQSMSASEFDYLLSQVDTIIVLDGFDEINDELRTDSLRSIKLFADKYSRASIIITSRPNDSEATWTGFRGYQIQPLSQEEAKALIQKFPYDEKLKSQFIKDFDDKIWPNHNSFASIPLLCILMVIVYARYGFLSNNLADFYQQSFEAVLFRHDRSKDFFVRSFSSGLSVTEFESIFSCFCFRSYIDDSRSFSRNEALGYIRRASETENIQCDSHSVLRDFVECACVLIKDGTSYRFSHRSFQEYFSARYATDSNLDVAKICEKFAGRRSDIALHLFYELNKDRVIADWLLPIFSRSQEIGLKDVEKFIKGVSYRSGGVAVQIDKTSVANDLDKLCAVYNGDQDTVFIRMAGCVAILLENLQPEFMFLGNSGKYRFPETEALPESEFNKIILENLKRDGFQGSYIEEDAVHIPIVDIKSVLPEPYRKFVRDSQKSIAQIVDWFSADIEKHNRRMELDDLI
jgi:hypothetical protein